jgi:hypothetical protein
MIFEKNLTCHDDRSHRQSLLDCGPYETKTCRQTQAQNQEQSVHDSVLSPKRRYDTPCTKKLSSLIRTWVLLLTL